MPAYRNLASATALLTATFALSACGGSSHHVAAATGSTTQSSTATQPAPDPVSEPNAVVVRVGGHAITKAAYAHALADRKSQWLALGFLISQQWVIGGAAEMGVHVSDRELEQGLKAAVGGQSQAQVARELAKTGLTWADFVLETKEQLLAEGIRRVFIRKTEHPSQAQISSYYDHNKQLFGVPKRRDLEILRAATEAQARKLKREIASGRSFASVVRALPSSDQPFLSKEGLVLGYEPGLYHQHPLDHAIFAAKPNVLSGPVKALELLTAGPSLGYYVFEVKRAYPSHQKTLAQVQATVKQQLSRILYKQALAAFIKGWRHKWRARTDCRPGYVVTKCRQYRAVGVPPPNEDPYTLN
jgi:foldase protein PrsA